MVALASGSRLGPVRRCEPAARGAGAADRDCLARELGRQQAAVLHGRADGHHDDYHYSGAVLAGVLQQPLPDLIHGDPRGLRIASSTVQTVLALVLIGLALALVKKGYDNISTVRDRGPPSRSNQATTEPRLRAVVLLSTATVTRPA